MNDHTPTTKDRILAAIHAGQVAMRPRWQFMLLAALWVTGAIVVALTLLFLMSFIFFSTHQTGLSAIPAFGLHGLVLFILSLPWLLILISLVFVGILEVLVRRYAFAWRRPLLFSLGGILVTVLLGGAVVARTSLHRGFMMRVDDGRLGFMAPMYNRYGGEEPAEIHKGIIEGMRPDGFDLRGRREPLVHVRVSPATKLPPGALREGDPVLVFGPETDDTIDALGVLPIDRDMIPRPFGGR